MYKISDERVLELYYDTSLRVPGIAKILGCSVSTVGRLFHRLDLPPRYSIPWKPPADPSSQLGYFLGAWITDGSIIMNPSQVIVRNTDRDFINYAHQCAVQHVIPRTKPPRLLPPNPTSKGSKQMYIVCVYNKPFTRWLESQSGKHKENIPPSIAGSSKETVVAFLSGVIDGDGHVSTEGCIRVRGTYPWLLEIPTLCSKANIRCTKPKLERTLPSGKRYRRIGVHRSDFLNAGGKLVIQYKQERLENPVYRTDRKRRTIPSTCPRCGQPKYYKSKMCQACHLSSEETLERLRSIAHDGNIAANIARWGKKNKPSQP